MRCGKKEEEEEEEVKLWRRRDQVKIYRVAVSHMGDGGLEGQLGCVWHCVLMLCPPGSVGCGIVGWDYPTLLSTSVTVVCGLRSCPGVLGSTVYH